ncbi:MAG TPA: class I SAM-dependent methyltransferase [Solirubrobacteraceae bacterium]
MEVGRRSFVDELYAVSHAHDRVHADRLNRFRNVEPATAELLGVLIRGCRSQRILELGTSNGYSTIWLADAAQATGGVVVTVDLDAARVEIASENVRDAGLEQVVDLRAEDAGRVLAGSGDAVWDFVFLDADRPAYASYLPDLVRVLHAGGVLAIDNVVSHEHELIEFTAAIQAEPAFTQMVVPVGAGLRLAVRLR